MNADSNAATQRRSVMARPASASRRATARQAEDKLADSKPVQSDTAESESPQPALQKKPAETASADEAGQGKRHVALNSNAPPAAARPQFLQAEEPDSEPADALGRSVGHGRSEPAHESIAAGPARATVAADATGQHAVSDDSVISTTAVESVAATPENHRNQWLTTASQNLSPRPAWAFAHSTDAAGASAAKPGA